MHSLVKRQILRRSQCHLRRTDSFYCRVICQIDKHHGTVNGARLAEVIDEEQLNKDVVSLGSKVKVLDVEFDEEMEYTIVGSTEADPMNGRISNESPLGIALLGQKKGASVMADTPDGEVEFRILDIQK